MSTRQPKWKLIAKGGDVNYLDHEGWFLYQDTTGVYPPEMEFLRFAVEDDGSKLGADDKARYTVATVQVERCFKVNNTKVSDNKFHRKKPNWFDLPSVASCHGVEVSELIERLTSRSPKARAEAYEMLVSYYGTYEFDQYPFTVTRKGAARRYSKRGIRTAWRRAPETGNGTAEPQVSPMA